jgi:hypothetical protein
MGIDVLLQYLNIFITDGKGFRIGLLLNKFFPLSLCNFTHMFLHQPLLHVVRIQFGLPLTEQPSHINNHRIIHNVLCTSWKLDFFLHIAPNLILYGRRHLSLICDGNWDIVSNLKSGSTYELFPCFKGFRWEPIRIMFCHVDNAGRHLIATSLPSFSFVIGDILRFCRGWTGLFRLGARSHLAQDCEPTNWIRRFNVPHATIITVVYKLRHYHASS